MKQRDILLILISVFIVTIAWIAFNVIHNSTTSTISENLTLQIIPIVPNFDNKAIEKLKARQTITPLYQFENQAPTTPAATTSPIVTMIPTPTISSISGTLTPTPQAATQGGTLQ